jgi:hypothetical protein
MAPSWCGLIPQESILTKLQALGLTHLDLFVQSYFQIKAFDLSIFLTLQF